MSRRWWVAGAAAAAALIIVGLFMRPRVAELLGLVASGGELQLRDPIRPPRGGPRVLVFALDGVGEDELLSSIEAGRSPAIRALLGAPDDRAAAGPGVAGPAGDPAATRHVFPRGYAVPGALSILPSTTLAAWSAVFTGHPAGMTGVPGNEWFVRDAMRLYAPAPVSVEGTADALASYTDDLLGSVLVPRTVYELADVRSYVSLSQFHRGADLLVVPAADALDDLVGAVARGITEDDESVPQEAYRELDLTAVDNLVEAMGDHGPADLQVVYLPGIDLYTHISADPIDTQRAYIAAVVDSAVSRVIEAYRNAGAMDDTFVLFVSDHGHTPVLADDPHALGVGEQDEPTAVLEQAGFRVRAPELELDEDERNYQAVVAYQGAFAYVYLADRSTCSAEDDVCDWNRPPRLAEDVLPVVSAFDAANRTGAGVPALQGSLDLILARDGRSTGGGAAPFRVWNGEGLVDMSAWLAANPRPDLLDFERRMSALATGPHGDRAGDVLLIAKSGAERPIEERFYFSSVYRSWHGSATEQDSRISLLLA
ncbi:MAG TPA: alkaline phosphatase family protein, partial [Longimicrobiales bacterium]|nr:alkaline phosphatase family protein [Longimicrobiales bacterium]